jgi:hypothetical protein
MATPVSSGKKASIFTTRASLQPRQLAFDMLLLLGLQFLLGMWNNLFITLPGVHPGTNAPEYFGGVGQGILWAIGQSGLMTLQLHVILGLLLLIGSILAIVSAFNNTQRTWKIVAPLGTFGILAAAFNGASFINYGHDFSSMLMAVGFLIALIAYLVGLYQSPRTA